MSIDVLPRVCCDANLVVRFLTQPDGTAAHTLWSGWVTRKIRVLAPDLLRFEITNAFFRMASAGDLSDAQAASALDAVWVLPIEYHSNIGFHRRSLALSRELNLKAAYDAHYLALAEFEGVEFFTSDRRLYKAAHRKFSWVILIE